MERLDPRARKNSGWGRPRKEKKEAWWKLKFELARRDAFRRINGILEEREKIEIGRWLMNKNKPNPFSPFPPINSIQLSKNQFYHFFRPDFLSEKEKFFLSILRGELISFQRDTHILVNEVNRGQQRSFPTRISAANSRLCLVFYEGPLWPAKDLLFFSTLNNKSSRNSS